MKNFMSSLFKIFFTIGLLFTIVNGFTQNSIVDSLFNVVKQNRATAETYNKLAQEHWYIDIPKSKEYALRALELAQEEQNMPQIGFAFNRLGTAFLYLQELDSAQHYYNKSVDVFEQQEMYTELAGATACCARIFETKFKYDSALYKYSKALDIFEMAEKSEYYVQTLMVVGGLYSNLGDFSNAQKYFDMALENKSHVNNYDLITMYNKIGINYQNLGNFRNAIKYFQDAFKACDLSDNNIALATTYVNIANLYIAWDKKEEALNYLEKGLEISKSTGIEYYKQTILLLIADIYLDFGQLDKAGEYYTNLLNSAHEPTNVFNEGKAYNGLAKIAANKHQYNEAIKHSAKALQFFEKMQRPFYIANSHYLLAANYLGKSDLRKVKEHLDKAAFIANQYSFKELEAEVLLLYARYNNKANNGWGRGSEKLYEKYIAIKDSLFEQQNQKLLAKFQVEMDNLEKDYQLKEAKSLNKLKEAELDQKKRQVTNISLISLLLLAGVFVFVVMYIKKQKANRLLFLKNKELVKKESKMQSKRDLVEIPESRQNEIIKKLNREMNENSIHLQTDLTLYSLSKALNTNSSYLSRIIQLNYNCNFSAFLNKHRIIEAQKMILDKSFAHYTIDAISHECGYKSKSTFNKAFKEITGLTPNEYKRQGEL